MYRKFIATVAVASIALTALGTAPAVAGEHNNARVIAALLGLAVVGKIIHDKKQDKKEAKHHQPAPIHQKPARHKPSYAQPTQKAPRYQQITPRPLPQRVQRKQLPQECLGTHQTRRGKVQMFGNHCLQQNFKYAARLPQQCEYTLNTPNGARRGYDARCLQKQGFH